MYASPTPVIKRRTKVKKLGNQTTEFRILEEPPPSLFPSRGEVLKLLLVVFIAGVVAIFCNLIFDIINRRPKPFCDSDDTTQDLDICEPCPEKGWCSNGNLVCVDGYEKQGRQCIENGQVYQAAKTYAKMIENDVCRSYAQVLCHRAGKIWFEEGDVLKLLDEHKAREDGRIEDDRFMLALQKAWATVQESLETMTNLNGSKAYKCPDRIAELRKPLECCIYQWLYKHSLLVVGVLTMVVWLAWFVWTLHCKQIMSSRAEKLYEEVCEILEDNAVKARTENGGNPWLVASWLRDHLLLPGERKDSTLWKKVEELIQEDSRIDKYPKLIKGESKVVLEWQADGALSSRHKLKAKKNAEKIANLSSQAEKALYQAREGHASTPLM